MDEQCFSQQIENEIHGMMYLTMLVKKLFPLPHALKPNGGVKISVTYILPFSLSSSKSKPMIVFRLFLSL